MCWPFCNYFTYCLVFYCRFIVRVNRTASVALKKLNFQRSVSPLHINSNEHSACCRICQTEKIMVNFLFLERNSSTVSWSALLHDRNMRRNRTILPTQLDCRVTYLYDANVSFEIFQLDVTQFKFGPALTLLVLTSHYMSRLQKTLKLRKKFTF